MSNPSLFVHVLKTDLMSNFSGILSISKETIPQAKAITTQNMPCDDAHLLAIKCSILERGYDTSYPIILNENSQTIDGYSRMMACISIVEDGDAERIIVPFYTADGEHANFNGSTRGASAADIQYLFKIPRHSGLLTGSAKRASEQAIEASQMLDVSKLDDNFDKAFDPSRVQRHTSKIVREQKAFKQSYDAVCELSTQMNINPDTIKWGHWMALFCRYGVNNSVKSIARKSLIENKGTTQLTRYQAFQKASESAFKLGSL